MGIADLGARSAIGFSCRFGPALYKTGIGSKILYSVEAIDIIYFIENNKTDDGSNAGNGL